jgi:hypothetical protein
MNRLRLIIAIMLCLLGTTMAASAGLMGQLFKIACIGGISWACGSGR